MLCGNSRTTGSTASAQFAERCPTEDKVAKRLATCKDWRQIAHAGQHRQMPNLIE
jgi:hypothetical protein